jgi:hypothetical protein
VVQWVVQSGRAVPLPFPGARVRVSGDSRGAWGHTGGIGVRGMEPGGEDSPHRVPPAQNGSGVPGGGASEAIPSPQAPGLTSMEPSLRSSCTPINTESQTTQSIGQSLAPCWAPSH